MSDEPDQEVEDLVLCPDCREQGVERFVKRRGLGLHRASVHGYRAGDDYRGRNNGRGRSYRTDDDAQPRVNLKDEVDRTVTSLATIGMTVHLFAPHTGLTLVSRAGDRELVIPGQEKPVRKKGIATVWGEYAARDPRILRAMVRFNNLVQGSDLIEIGISLAAAVAVDAHVIDPDLTVRMPGMPEGMGIQPIHAFIGDVVAQVREDQGYEPAPELVPEPQPEEVGAPA